MNSYCIEQNFGGKKLWRNGTFETLAKKTLANPRPVCVIQEALKRSAAIDFMGETDRKNWRKNLANCGNSPNSPKFSPRQSFVLYSIEIQLKC